MWCTDRGRVPGPGFLCQVLLTTLCTVDLIRSDSGTKGEPIKYGGGTHLSQGSGRAAYVYVGCCAEGEGGL